MHAVPLFLPLHDKEDHFQVIAELQGQVTGKTQKGATVKYDPVALRHKELARKFGDLLDARPLPAWETNVNYHFDETVDTIKDVAKQCFEKKRRHTHSTAYFLGNYEARTYAPTCTTCEEMQRQKDTWSCQVCQNEQSAHTQRGTVEPVEQRRIAIWPKW